MDDSGLGQEEKEAPGADLPGEGEPTARSFRVGAKLLKKHLVAGPVCSLAHTSVLMSAPAGLPACYDLSPWQRPGHSCPLALSPSCASNHIGRIISLRSL